ncbi:cutinase gene palindrome-binding protein [Podospora didyma]|uniref:Cutinase gene palindrome-binding protein n=1 Tax=Podospora didyma TaxID=330526 RepID=A0AAE0P5K2_9PEZI|nr:cutinase gene palindrome-binding protein [Podospora didyma]
MSLLDGSMFPPFDGMAMNLDVGDAMSQSFAPAPVQALAPVAQTQLSANSMPGAGGDGDQGYSPADDTPNPVSCPGPLAISKVGASGAAAASGGSNPINPGNPLTEFTKRRGWTMRVVEELQDLLQILDTNGRIKHVSASVKRLLGYDPPDVIDSFLKDLIHLDDQGVFISELNESIATGTTLRLFYRVRRKDGTYAIFETIGHAHIAAAKFAPNPNNKSPFCQAIFLMSRTYPTKNSRFLDSFLEHKIENERLMRRIAELKREEAEEVADESQKAWRQSQEGRSDITVSEDAGLAGGTTPFYPALANQDISSDTASISSSLTRENLEGVAGRRPDSIREKMARYEGAPHVETIERLTGLRYLEGERGLGLSSGNASPTLIRGDAGIAIPMDRDPRTGEKKKKIKVAEEYVCTDCGTLESPEWRKGPSGPKTLCNACGLRWAKNQKKEKNKTNGGGGQQEVDIMG